MVVGWRKKSRVDLMVALKIRLKGLLSISRIYLVSNFHLL